MTIYIKIKAMSSRRPIIDRTAFEITENVTDAEPSIEHDITDAKSLIEYVVRKNVKDYNDKLVDVRMLPYLTSEEIENSAVTGKTGFGERRNENNQNPEDAVKNALTCFDDGIFRLFINDEECKGDGGIHLKEGDEVTFIRLTMLSGRRW